MINSLSKDSHITHSLCIPNLPRNSRESVAKRKSGLNVTLNTTENNYDKYENNIRVSKPAEISFCGFAGAKLANCDSFANLMSKAKEVFPQKVKLKDLRSLITEAVSGIVKGETKSAEAKTLLAQGKPELEAVVEEANKLVAEDTKGKSKTSEEIAEEFNDAIKCAVDGFRGLEEFKNKKNPSNFYNNKIFRWCLEKANENQIFFSALFALVLTCALRPAAIMVTPGDKKNHDDKKYASAHSIASGLIGLGATILLSNPIAHATKKITENPETFIENKNNYMRKSKKYLYGVAEAIKMLTVNLYNPPRAMLTIALIPIVLKGVFGLSKHKHGAEKKEGGVKNEIK